MVGLVKMRRRSGIVIIMMAFLTLATVFAQDEEELVKKSLPYLSERIHSLSQDVYADFLAYAIRVLKPEWIKSDEDLDTLFKQRDSFLERIRSSGQLEEFLSKEAEQWVFKNGSGNWEKYDRELELIGIRTVFAEGMLAGYAEGPVLEILVNGVASGAYLLYIRMREAYAGSYGGEYTYMDLKAEMEAILHGEELLSSYSGSKYEDQAELILSQALFPLTDWHVILPDNPTLINKPDYYPFCIVGDLNTETYPYWTDIGQPKQFLENYPGSIFHDVVAKIIDEPSEIRIGKTIYVVVTDEFGDEVKARKAILSYLVKGIDIPHFISLGHDSYVVAYRFFADPEKAKKALERIKQIKPEATIREIQRAG